MGYVMVLWRAVTYRPPVWVLVLQPLLFWSVQPAFGHTDAMLNCNQNIKYSQAVKVSQDVYLTDRGLYAEHYDTNGDGKLDVVALSYSNTHGKTHRENPVFWLVDTDADGKPDALYIDKKGLGVCTDIVLYDDMTMRPFSPEINPEDRGGEF